MIADHHIQPPNAISRIATLLDRERRTSFSGGVLGYVWAYITPVVWIALIVALFRVLERTPPIHVATEIFIATGILTYLIFRQTVSAMSRGVIAHRQMRYLRPVSINDILTAIMLLEGFNLLITTALIFGGITVLLATPLPEDLPAVFASLAVAWALGCGVGRFVATVGLLSDSFARAVPLIMRPLFWLTGIFYTATELPVAVQEILWYSPLLHVTEMTREAYFLGFTSPIAAAWYPLAVAAVFFLASIPVENFATRRRIMRHRL